MGKDVLSYTSCGGLAQLVRASASHAEGQRFKSAALHQKSASPKRDLSIFLFPFIFHPPLIECPSGTGPQASSMMRASARPSSTRLALSELTLRLNSVTASIPPSKYFFTVLVTVARHTPFDFTDCSWVNTFPWDSSRSMMIWHLHQIVLDVLFFRMTNFKLFNSSSVSSILYFFGLAIGNHRRFFCIRKRQ